MTKSYVALCDNQIRVEDKRSDTGTRILTKRRGDVIEADKAPSEHWEQIAGEGTVAELDFETASEQALLGSDAWKFAELQEFCKKNYDIVLEKGPKKEVVKNFLDAKFRAVSSSNTGQLPNVG